VTEALHQAVSERLAGAGQRYTRGRRQILEALAAAARPLTIAELIGGGMAQSSAYRNLAVLERAGAVRRIQGSDEFARYELSEDLSQHHHHLICTNCGSVVDFALSPRLEKVIDGAVGEIAAETGFRPDAHRLDLVGACTVCA
jgi:Fe2+ or Zn2+ uptake regulation protein